MTARFAHLHVHSEYSLVDSTIRIKELVAACVARDLPAVALTDQNNLFALVKFYKAAEGAGIKPIAGADLMVADGGDAPSMLTLLCRDRSGYLSLSRLLSRAWLEGQRGDCVAIDPEWLRDDHAGLCAIAGRRSLAGRLALGHRHDLAEAQLAEWQRVFGDDLHLQLARTGRDGEEAFNRFALDVAGRRGIPVVAGNDVRFLDADGFDAHEARVCIAGGRVLDDPRRPREYTDQQHLKSAGEMAALFADVPDALDNAVALARRCNLELKLGTYFLPAYPVPSDQTLDSWIRSQSHAGLEARLERNPLAAGKTREDYVQRLDFELDTIVRMGFPGYFLIVADFIQWGKANGIPIGPGRGSGAGSLVAWALQITDLDPLPYNLLFERFLNPERVSMPDFDIDFCMDRRDEVIDYVARKYGRDRVSQIITYGTMAAKAVLRDSGRVLGFGYGMVDGIAKLIPNILGIALKDAMGQGKGGMDGEMASPELIARYQSEDDVRDLIDLALQLEDLTRNAGKHAGGVVIAPTPLSDFCPLYAEHDPGTLGKNPVTQFDKDDVEAIGLVKFDFLGLRTLTIIDWAVKAINARRAQEGKDAVDIATIPLDDASVYRDVFANGNTGSVFQFESAGMRRALKDAKPDRFEDLIALNALYRPGPMEMIPSFVARKHGTESFEYPDPRTRAMLEETYGIMVYQEQVMQMAQIVGGYSLGGADLLRRAMGKKVPAEMAKHREIFRDGAAAGGVGTAKADEIFDLMEKFAGYGFNKSHAAAYSLVAYQTAWLKKHFPSEFMAATLSSDMDKTDKVVGFLDEARGLGLTVLPPDANHSDFMFVATDARTVRYGLGAVKGVGQGACEAIVAARQAGGAFADLLDFCKRVDSGKLNKRALEALVHAGALDALGRNRASLMQQLPEVLKAIDQINRNRNAGIVDMFGNAASGSDIEVRLPQVEAEWPLAQKLQGERDTLGFYLSGHPMDEYAEDLRDLLGNDLGGLDRLWASQPAGERKGWRPETTVVLGGQVVDVRRRGDSQIVVVLEDGRGRVECSAFSDAAAEYSQLLTRGRILVVRGGLREDEFAGGYSLRLRDCWDYDKLCAEHARRLSLRMDLRQSGALGRFEQVLQAHAGPTPLLIEATTGVGIGRLTVNGGRGLRVDAALPNLLRGLPGISKVSLQLARPWAH